jgi:hypothetical protein
MHGLWCGDVLRGEGRNSIDGVRKLRHWHLFGGNWGISVGELPQLFGGYVFQCNRCLELQRLRGRNLPSDHGCRSVVCVHQLRRWYLFGGHVNMHQMPGGQILGGNGCGGFDRMHQLRSRDVPVHGRGGDVGKLHCVPRRKVFGRDGCNGLDELHELRHGPLLVGAQCRGLGDVR